MVKNVIKKYLLAITCLSCLIFFGYALADAPTGIALPDQTYIWHKLSTITQQLPWLTSVILTSWVLGFLLIIQGVVTPFRTKSIVNTCHRYIQSIFLILLGVAISFCATVSQPRLLSLSYTPPFWVTPVVLISAICGACLIFCVINYYLNSKIKDKDHKRPMTLALIAILLIAWPLVFGIGKYINLIGSSAWMPDTTSGCLLCTADNPPEKYILSSEY